MSEVQCFVYFVQAGAGGNIKIGISRNVVKRLTKMQTDVADKISLLAVVPGDEKREATLHQELVAHRVHGEWFKPHGDVLAVVARERAAHGNVEFFVKPMKRQRIGRTPFEAWRLRCGLTAEKVAGMVGMSRPMITRIDDGGRLPGWELMESIYRISNGEITPNDFAAFMREAKSEVA